MKKFYKILSILLILAIFFASDTFALRGKRVLAGDKYIWVYVNGERKLLADNAGYPCFGQGIDNKNILYMPLNIIANISGYVVSPLRRENGEDGEVKMYVTVTNESESFNVYLGDTNFNGMKMADYTFILKGTEESGNPVFMVPLGVAKDYFKLNIECKRPVGRGIYDYCSLGVNFSGGKPIEEGSSGIISVILSGGDASRVDYLFEIEDLDDYNTYYVSSGNNYLHNKDCQYISKNYVTLNYLECIYWGFERCPVCIEDSDPGFTQTGYTH